MRYTALGTNTWLTQFSLVLPCTRYKLTSPAAVGAECRPDRVGQAQLQAMIAFSPGLNTSRTR